MKKIAVSEMLRAIFQLEAEGRRCTLLGIGPMSKLVIEAAFQLAKEKDFPLMFIASRNQVDTKELGGGYVCNWDQYGFVEAIADLARQVGFEGIYHICRDHGGPWQRDNERGGKLPEPEAMAKGKQSYLADLLAGFDLLHIDPTKDPHIQGVVPLELVLDRTVELIGYVEQERTKRDLSPVAYEVGTEETNGGLISAEIYGEFIKELAARLTARKLPLPSFIVGQTGTLTRLTENVGHFDPDTARNLSTVARRYGVGLKEHNGDYLPDFLLYLHPLLHITAMNVAPEFGVVETGSYLLMAQLEEDAHERGLLESKSDFRRVLQVQAVQSQRWRKWMLGEGANTSVDGVMRDAKMVASITEICGHYTFENPEVKREMAEMFRNLARLELNPHQLAITRIKNSIARYVDCFNLAGLTTKIAERLNYRRLGCAQ